jgi:hypothetical protein
LIGAADVVVVPDRGGEGEDALPDAYEHAGAGASAVLFEIELALEGVVDRLDDLAQWLEQAGARAVGFALAGWTQQLDVGFGQRRLELGAEVVLVADSSWQS